MQMALVVTTPWPPRLPAGLMYRPLPPVLPGHHPAQALAYRTRAAASAAQLEWEKLEVSCDACSLQQVTVSQAQHRVEHLLTAALGLAAAAAGCCSPSPWSSTPLGGWTCPTCRQRCKGLQLERLAALRSTYCCLHLLLPLGCLRLLMTIMLLLLLAQLCAAASSIQRPLQLRKCRSRLRLVLLNQRMLVLRHALTLLVSAWALQPALLPRR